MNNIISFMLYNTLRQYEYIVAVAEAGSLTEAAAVLHVSQPSLSVAISRVEERLGQQIFVRRKGATLAITPFGHRLVDRMRDLLTTATEIEQSSEQARPFVLGCFEDIAPWYLAPAIDLLESHYPALAFQGTEGRFLDLAADLSEGRVDVAISYDIGFEGKFERQKIREISPVAFLSMDHPLAAESSVRLAQLVDYPMILFNEDLSEGFIRSLFERLKLVPDIRRKVSSLEMMRSFAAHGDGVGISYSHPPNGLSYDGKPLVTLPISDPEAAAGIKLIWSSLREPSTLFVEIVSLLVTIE